VYGYFSQVLAEPSAIKQAMNILAKIATRVISLAEGRGIVLNVVQPIYIVTSYHKR